jgi:hypothetical protein
MDTETEKIIKKPILAEDTYYGSNNPFSQFFLNYAYPIIRLGNKKPLTYEDIPKINDNYEFDYRFADFNDYYEKKKKVNYQTHSGMRHFHRV